MQKKLTKKRKALPRTKPKKGKHVLTSRQANGIARRMKDFDSSTKTRRKKEEKQNKALRLLHESERVEEAKLHELMLRDSVVLENMQILYDTQTENENNPDIIAWIMSTIGVIRDTAILIARAIKQCRTTNELELLVNRNCNTNTWPTQINSVVSFPRHQADLSNQPEQDFDYDDCNYDNYDTESTADTDTADTNNDDINPAKKIRMELFNERQVLVVKWFRGDPTVVYQDLDDIFDTRKLTGPELQGCIFRVKDETIRRTLATAWISDKVMKSEKSTSLGRYVNI